MDVPWLRDPCPPAPFVSAATARVLGGGTGLVEVLPGVVAAAAPGWADGTAGAGPRARGLAWATGLRSGVVVRLAAVWVWCGHPSRLPGRVRVAAAPDRPLAAEGLADGVRDLLLVPTRWCGSGGWCEVGGVGVTDPVTTAEECLRLETPAAAGAALRALLRAGLVDAEAVAAALRARHGARGRAGALARLEELRALSPR